MAQVPFVFDEADPGIGMGADNRRGPVGRAVVDDDQLEVAKSLAEDGADRGVDGAAVVVGWDANGDERWIHVRPLFNT